MTISCLQFVLSSNLRAKRCACLARIRSSNRSTIKLWAYVQNQEGFCTFSRKRSCPSNNVCTVMLKESVLLLLIFSFCTRIIYDEPVPVRRRAGLFLNPTPNHLRVASRSRVSFTSQNLCVQPDRKSVV